MRVYAVHLGLRPFGPMSAMWETACGRTAIEMDDTRGPWSEPSATLTASEVNCATCRRTTDFICLQALERNEARELPDNVIPLRRTT